MEKEFYTIQMEIFMKENGWMTKQMAKGPTLIQMEPNTLENGRMISKMDLGFRSG